MRLPCIHPLSTLNRAAFPINISGEMRAKPRAAAKERFTDMARWTFAPNPMGEVEGPNNAGISAFTSDRAGSLVRELLQNSMDARADASKPVIVSFRLESLSAGGLDLDGLRLSLEAAIDSEDNDDRHQKQFRRGLSVLKDAIRNRAIPALTITDSNTAGAPDIP